MAARVGACLWILALACAAPAGAQDTGALPPMRPQTEDAEPPAPQPGALLTIETERLLQESAYGQRVLREIEDEGRAIAAESERIAEELRAEEQELTDRRDSMEPQEFRAAAEAFNDKVERLRQQQDAKAQEFSQRTEQVRRRIVAAARPVLLQIMQEAGAAALIERRQVYVSSESADITALAIERLDARIGDGSDLEEPVAPVPSDGDFGADSAPTVPILPGAGPRD
ncbi:Outer membrane protein (OmpH-like) [Roseivivax jejudonensis]|uniref:Outer membrane protein (OmpH-like) n=1 Tax=Roseivivax jejudonensis TaxID=1529041 RepID=A0A1X6YUN1_9RHOB|nr:OmpH family outer membrane protein [Roseivivax jejudonensis]SLN31385.1 Outer membrane protein (OmpH-like) [Roseivivax jejudonensis]